VITLFGLLKPNRGQGHVQALPDGFQITHIIGRARYHDGKGMVGEVEICKCKKDDGSNFMSMFDECAAG
jgi:hypothetical protein